MATTPVTAALAASPAAALQAAAAAKLKAATVAKKPPPILSTSKAVPPVAAPKIVLPPGINFAALAAQDAKNKAAQAKQPGGKMVNGYYLPPGINFAALKATDDAAKAAKLAAKPPPDPLQATYDAFKTEMTTQGKDTTAMYDKIMKEMEGFYTTADKQTATDYAPSLAALKQLTANIGGPANATSYGDLPAEMARLSGVNKADLAATKSSMDMLKMAIPGMFSSVSQGVMGDLQQAIMDRAAAEQARKDAAAAALAARSGGGGGGGGRSYRRSGSGSGSSGVKNSATETYTSAIDAAATEGMTPAQYDMYMKTRRENAGVDVNPAMKAAQTKYEYAQAAAGPAGLVQYVFSKMGTGKKTMSNAEVYAYQKQKQAEANNWAAVVNGMQKISGWGGGTKGSSQTKSTGKY